MMESCALSLALVYRWEFGPSGNTHHKLGNSRRLFTKGNTVIFRKQAFFVYKSSEYFDIME